MGDTASKFELWAYNANGEFTSTGTNGGTSNHAYKDGGYITISGTTVTIKCYNDSTYTNKSGILFAVE